MCTYFSTINISRILAIWYTVTSTIITNNFLVAISKESISKYEDIILIKSKTFHSRISHDAMVICFTNNLSYIKWWSQKLCLFTFNHCLPYERLEIVYVLQPKAVQFIIKEKQKVMTLIFEENTILKDSLIS